MHVIDITTCTYIHAANMQLELCDHIWEYVYTIHTLPIQGFIKYFMNP